ncbi:hypothetical protein HPP92_023043 [Vanilla planifolia]|uniref:Uncharacterized protein n=1 Tax=Vanilla planifolia TaxID=51239 RepID=A0A835UFW6_VANPL|nr:hypothetical protein HPP92_023043 [Vanilla planifolia]
MDSEHLSNRIRSSKRTREPKQAKNTFLPRLSPPPTTAACRAVRPPEPPRTRPGSTDEADQRESARVVDPPTN